MSQEVELLARWQTGDKAAGGALFEIHYPAMVRFFRNKVDDAARDDLIQQTFLAASQAQFNGRARVLTWLIGIAWRKMMEHFRSEARRGRFEDPDPSKLSVAAMGQSPETWVQAKEESRLLLEGLRKLPLQQQVVLELHFWEQLSGSQIAEALSIPLGTVKTRLRDGRLRLAKAVEALTDSPDLLRSTIDDLQKWAERAREAAGPR